MASFCTKCGSALLEGSQFCTACGTPAAGTGAASAVSAQPPPMQPQPVQPQPGGASALKIILIIVAVFVGIGILSGTAFMFGLWRLSRVVKVNSHYRDQVSISTPMGNISTGSAPVTEAEVGAPIYPNAKRNEGNISFSTPQGSMATYVFKTSDPLPQVVEFYRGKLGAKANVIETPEATMFTSAQGEKEGVAITIGKDQDATVITIIRGRSVKAP